MNSYTVKWIINVDADTPQQAAEAAMEVMVDPFFPDAFFVVADGEKETLVKVPYPDRTP